MDAVEEGVAGVDGTAAGVEPTAEGKAKVQLRIKLSSLPPPPRLNNPQQLFQAMGS